MAEVPASVNTLTISPNRLNWRRGGVPTSSSFEVALAELLADQTPGIGKPTRRIGGFPGYAVVGLDVRADSRAALRTFGANLRLSSENVAAGKDPALAQAAVERSKTIDEELAQMQRRSGQPGNLVATIYQASVALGRFR